MCCAMQLDAVLARRAVEEVVEEPRRAVASSPGVDLSCVLAYALAARSRQVIRDCALAVLLFLLLVGGAITGGLLVIPVFLIAWAIVAGELFYVNWAVIVPKLSRTTFNPNAAPAPHSQSHMNRLTEIAQWDDGNVTVSQSFTPFTGYGQQTGAWSYAIRTDEPKEGADTVQSFEVHALYDHIAAAVEDLRLPGVRVQDRLVVNGADLQVNLDDATSRALLPDQERAPVPHVQPRLIHDLREDGSGRARPYLALQICGWEGELVATHFLRFYLSPKRDVLFAENSVTLLAPVRAAYRSVDILLSHPTFRQSVEIIVSSFMRTIALLIRSVPELLGVIRHHLGSKRRRQLREIKHRSFNYGAPLSLRQAASDQLYYRYFQKIDVEMYNKVVIRRLLDSLIEFLDQHDIDTSDLRDQSTIVAGGFSIGENANVSFVQSAVAVGQNAVGRVLQGPGAMSGSSARSPKAGR
jgi:hypothetical protein